MNNVRVPLLCGLLLAGLLGAPSVRAQSTDTWVGGADNTLGTSANWSYSSGTGPVVTGDSLVFAGTGSATPTNNLTGFTFDSLTFPGGAQAYTLMGNAFTLGTTTPGTAITVNSGNSQTISNAVVLAAAAQTISLSAGNLTLRGLVSGTGGGLTLAGSGTLTLTNTAADTYTGPTVVNGGTLDLFFPNAGNSGIYLSSGLIINNGATVAATDNSLAGSTATLGDLPVTINAGGTLTGLAAADGGEGGSTHIRGLLTLNGGTLANAGTGVETAYGDWDLDDGVVVNGGTTPSTISALDIIPDQAGGTVFNVANGGTVGGVDLIITGNLIHGSSLADTGILKTNAGTLALLGTNTYTGATLINGGTLEVNGAGELAAPYAGAIAITNAGVFIYNSSQPQILSGVISGGGTLSYLGAGILTLAGANTFTGTLIDNGSLIISNNAVQTLSGLISGSGTLTQAGSGTVTLAGVNTYTGNTTISGGTLAGAPGGSLSSAVTVAPATGASASVGVSSAGTGSQWTLPSLVINAGGNYAGLQYTFTATPSVTTAPIYVTGNVTFNATPVVSINAKNLPIGSYPLLVVGGTVPTTVPTLPARGYGSCSLAWGGSGFSANTLVLNVASSFTTIADPLYWAAAGNGTWDVNDSGNAIWKDSTAAPQTTFYQQLAGAVGDSVVFGDEYVSANTTVNLNSTVTPASMVVTNSSYNYTITGSGTVAGTGGLIKVGTAALTLSTSNSFTGGVTADAGTLTLDFTSGTAPATNILSPANALILGGGTLNMNGGSLVPNSQTVNGLTITAGNSVVNAAPVSGANAPVLILGAFAASQGPGATLEFSGPATLNSAGPVSATATITTTTAGTGTLGNMGAFGNGKNGANVTVGLYDWATTDLAAGTAGASPYPVLGGSQVTGFYQTTGITTAGNYDILSSGVNTLGNAGGAATLRFNNPTATNITFTATTAQNIQGILVTPNMGANNAFFSPSKAGYGLEFQRSTSGGNSYGVIWQNNVSAYLDFIACLNGGRQAGQNNGLVQAGPGTVVYGGVNLYELSSYLNGGFSVITADSGFGLVGNASMVYLNGGTVVGNATFTLDNTGANLRPITLLGNGGGLAATTGNTMTVDGQIGSAPGVGPLVIGIPASAANGNVAGLLPGSGPNTANSAPVYGTGTVVLNNLTGNFYYGGTLITGGATLNINGNYALGGANYLGGLMINNGVLQYNSTLKSSADISQSSGGVPQTVTFAGNATIDANGLTVVYANPVGNGGSGSLTVTNSGSPGVGGLFLNGGSSHTGGTLVVSGAVLGGTNSMAGNLTWAGGSYAALTQGAPLMVSGTVTLNNPSVIVTATGLTTGVYTLLTARGGITSGSTVSPTPVGTGIVASGYGGTVSISGGSVVLTVIQLGVAATWADGLADQTWSEGGNWSGGFAPQNPGDAATFGTGGLGVPVNLNQNETVGGITFNNAGSYTITGTSTLAFDNKGKGAGVLVTAGTANAIDTAVLLNDSFDATVNPGDAVTLGGIIANGSGAETLTANGGGLVILTGANTYGPATGTVGTTLSGITLQVGNNSALGAGDVNVTANSTLQAGAVGLNLANNLAVGSGHTVTVANNGNVLTLGGVLSGSGVVAATGAGTVILGGGNNTYTGGTLLNGGILSISSDGAVAGGAGSLGLVPSVSLPNNLWFNGGDLQATATLTLLANRSLGIGSASLSSTATTTALIDAAAGQILTIDGVIASAGNLGMNNLTVNSEPGSTGEVVLSGADSFNGTNIISAGTEQLGNPLALQNSTLFYNNQGGLLDFGTQTAATLGSLSGTQNLTLVNDSAAAVALTLDNNNTIPRLYTGVLGDNGSGASLTLNGPGLVQQIGSGAIGGATYAGATALNEGSLILGGKTALTGAVNLTGLNGPCNLTVQDSATITASAELYLASAGGSAYPGVSTLTLAGNAMVSAPSFSFGNASRVPTGCFVTIAGNATLNVTGDFELEDAEGSTAQNNVVNLNGGTLAAGNFTLTYATAGTHQATINFNGGVLTANASDPAASQFLPALTALTVNVLTNGVSIDPNSYTITIAAPLTGAGGLTNFGTGTLSLAGANTYAGLTVVSNDTTLNVVNPTGSATGTNTVVVEGSGRLEGTGTIAGNVVWQPGALVTFNAGASPTPLTVGAVTLNNNGVTINVSGNTPLPIGVYKLMNYLVAGSTGAFNPTPGYTGAGVVGDVQSVIATSGGVVTLTVSPNVTYNVWDVDASGQWTTVGDWSSAPVPGNPGDAALLGAGTIERTVTLNASESLGYLTLSNANSFIVANAGHALTLDNSGLGAFVTVSGGTSNLIQTAVNLNDTATVTVYPGDALAVTGVVANSPAATQAETLTVSGAGTLLLANANTYGPAPGVTGTTLEGGILQVGNNLALGAGDVSVAGNGTLQSGAAGLAVTNNLAIASGVTATLDDNGHGFVLGGVISGGGAVTKAGNGTLTLTNNNSFGGGLLVSTGTLVLAVGSSSGSGPVTNSATLRLTDPNAISDTLTLISGSTLQLRSDTSTTFSLGSLLPQNAADTLTFDVGPVTSGVAGNTLTLGGSLAFTDSQANQIINVTGTNDFTLALGDLSAISATSHNPYQLVDINVLPGANVSLASFTCGNWGDFLDFSGGGSATVTGNLSNTSNGSILLLVDGGTTLTLEGSTIKANAGDAYRYLVENGVLIADNNTALINDTTGTLNNQSLFILGPATNIVYTGTTAIPAGYQTVNTNNSVNCAFYLGDPGSANGGITVAATVTNNVSDGDLGFTNRGVMTIGGLNTNGVNTFANDIILGWTANRGKSVTLVAATGGEVDFTGNLLANGTDKTAGITVGNATFGGLVKLAATNTYYGPTIINDGTLALANPNGYDAYIGNSTSISINARAVLDVTGQSSGTLPLGTGAMAQTLLGSGSVNGILTVGSQGTVAPGTTTATGVLTVSNSVMLGGATVMKLNNAGTPNSDKLVSPAITGGGTLTVTNLGPALVAGQVFHLFNTAVSGFTAVTLPVSDHNYKYTWTTNLALNGTLVLQSATLLVNLTPAPITSSFNGMSLVLSWPADHTGWRLQVQTNSLSTGLGANWVTVPGSTTTDTETLPVDSANGAVFYRLVYP